MQYYYSCSNNWANTLIHSKETTFRKAIKIFIGGIKFIWLGEYRAYAFSGIGMGNKINMDGTKPIVCTTVDST